MDRPTAKSHSLKGLVLGGQPLELPRLYDTRWKAGQSFTAIMDPDRTRQPWQIPEFIDVTKPCFKDPMSQRRKTSAEELQLKSAGMHGNRESFARIVHNVLDEEDCAALISKVNEKGFTPALINTGAGNQSYYPDIRDGHRVIVDSPELTQWLFHVLEPYLPNHVRGGHLVELNDRCRILCYTPGQFFDAHYDQEYTRPESHQNAGDYSCVTLQLYLHDVPVENGGATTFLGGRGRLPAQPRAGSVLLFSQDLYHEGSLLNRGIKYTMRTEAMYRRTQVCHELQRKSHSLSLGLL